MIIGTPTGVSLPDIPISECAERFGQIQKVFVQRTYNNTNVNGFDIDGGELLLSTWQDKIFANDSTKIGVSPYLNSPTMELGDNRTYTPLMGGVDRLIGQKPSKFTCELHDIRQDTVLALKSIHMELLSIWLINEDGYIGGVVDNNNSPTFIQPISICGYFVSDVIPGGFDKPDINRMTLLLPSQWSNRFKILVPNFDPREDLETLEATTTFDSTLITFDSTIETFDAY